MNKDYRTALKEHYTYQTTRGFVQTEDLFDMPLRNDAGFDLNNVAKTLSACIKDVQEEEFVPNTKDTDEVKLLKSKLEIVKDVINVKITERDAALEARENKAKKDKLVQLLEKKRDEALEDKTEEELLAELAELDQ